MSTTRHRYITRVAFGYFVVAMLWILLSDRLFALFADVSTIIWFSTVKGLFFVLITTVLLYYSMHAVPSAYAIGTWPANLETALSHSTPLSRLSRLSGYAFALALTGGMLLLRSSIPIPFGEHPLLIMFVFPIIVSALFGGLGPGLSATVLASAAALYYMPPVGRFRILQAHDILPWTMLVTNGVAVSILGDVMRRSLQGAQRSRELLLAVTNGTSDAVFVKDRNGRYLLINEGGARLLGKPVEEILERDDTVLISSEGASRLKALDQAIMDSGRVKTLEENIELIDGRKITLYVTKGPVFDRSGTVVGLFGVSRDITERKQMETALRESEERYRTVADYTYDWEYWQAPDGTVLYMSPSCERISGYRPDEFIENSRLLEEIVAPEDRKALERHRAEPLSGRRDDVVHETEFRIIRKDGEQRWIAHICQMIQRVDGTSLGLRASNRDVTEHRKVMAQLLQMQKIEAVGQLAGGIAHDFNNVLNAVTGYAGLLQMRMTASDPLRSFVDEIVAAAQRGGSLTHQILAFSRKQVLTIKPVSLNWIVANLDKMLRRLVREDIRIDIRLPERDIVISAEAGQIDQVLMNLVTNARDAMPGGGRISITVEPFVMDASYIAMHGYGVRGDYALLTVSDTGSGMDPETQSRIFDPFFTTKEAGKGTGLGLAVVHGIVKQHNGFINVYSEPGRGTVFKIYLPVATSGAAREAPIKTHTAVRGGSETILIAEDDPALRRITTAVLAEYGYNIIAAIDGEDAVAKYRANKDSIRLAILDGIMPNKNGRQALEEIRLQNPDLRALFVSGYTNEVFDEGAIPEGTTAFLRKPVTPDALLGMVRELLDKK